MKMVIKNIAAVCFLILFLPYVLTLLAAGRQGINQEEPLSEQEYKVLEALLAEDLSWMDEQILCLMAVLKRTEVVRQQETGEPVQQEIPSELYGEVYSRAYKAVKETKGQVVTIGGEFRELPYHGISSGRTRAGSLLGETYTYIKAVDCPMDLEAEEYLQFFYMDQAEFQKCLGQMEEIHPVLERDEAGYVNRMILGETVLQGEKARELLHLPSSCFFLEEDGSRIRITVKGSGHGFGISLYTAGRMMKDGADLNGIFQQFYEDAECITLP